MQSRILLTAIVLLGGTQLTWGAFQEVVPFGPTISLTPTTVATDPSFGGVVVADDTREYFGLNFKGDVQTRVLRTSAGTLDFHYLIRRFEDASGLPRVLRDLRLSGFEGFKTSVTWKEDGLGDKKWLSSIRFPNVSSASHGLNFSFADSNTGTPSSFVTGDTSYAAVVRTNATEFRNGAADVYLTSAPGLPFEQWLSREIQLFVPRDPCDLNGDGSIDAADAGIMFASWGGPGSTSPADKNRDGYVDAADAGILFARWTGDSVPSATTVSVPEPQAWGVLVAGLGLLARHRTKRPDALADNKSI